MKRIQHILICMLLAGIMLLGQFPAVYTKAEEGGTATELSLSFRMPKGKDGKEALLTDDRADTFVRIEAGLSLTINAEDVDVLSIRWHRRPTDATIRFLSEGSVLSSTDPDTGMLNSFLHVPEGTTGVEFSAGITNDIELSDVTAYTEGVLPDSVQDWKPASQCDVLIIVPFPGDEFRYFGGLLTTFLQDGISYNVCYLGAYSRRRVEEALAARWSLGLDTYPVFVSCDESRSLEYKYLKKMWSTTEAGKTLKKVFSQLRPQVVISCAKDECNDAAAQPTLEIVSEAVKEDKGKNVQKYYTHGTSAHATRVSYSDCIPSMNGMSAQEAAQSLLDSFTSLRKFRYKANPDASFTLTETHVGDDRGSTLFDNLKIVANPMATVSPTPEPTATPSPTPAPTDEPVIESAEESSPAPTKEALSVNVTVGESVQVQVVTTPAAEMTQAPKKGLFSCGAQAVENQTVSADANDATSVTAIATSVPTAQLTRVPTPEPTKAATPIPTPEPTKAATPIPTPEPTEEPTAEPEERSDWSEYFLDHTDAGSYGFSGSKEDGVWTYRSDEEYISADKANGHWEYRTDELSILIDETITTVHEEDQKKEAPLIYYAAHVRMRTDQYRSGFGNEGRTGRTSDSPWKMARSYTAVLLITGDNMLNMDVELKGILMRDGKIYKSDPKTEMMSWDPVTRMIGVHLKNTVTTTDFRELGVEDVHSFGPWLIHESVKNPELAKSSLYKRNPRTGVGMIEPGHLVIIVADGRQEDRSMGLNLSNFANLFVEQGCTEAYNLDGGVSAAMVFMGEQLNTHMDIKDKSKQRNLPDGLMWGYTEQCPLLTDPIYNDGIRTGGKVNIH